MSKIAGKEAALPHQVKKYIEGKVPNYIIDLSKPYAGLNLEFTTDIVMFADGYDAHNTQVIGRANRPGRTAPLRVHYLKATV